MNLYKKLTLFLLLQALIFLGAATFFIYNEAYPSYLVLEKTINENCTINPTDSDQRVERQAFHQAKESVKKFVLIIIIIGVTFIISAVLFMQHIILKPIHKLKEQMKWIVDNQTFKPIDTETKNNDEFKDLKLSFNSLIAHVVKQNAALESLSLTDPLTQLQNRRSMENFIDTLSGFLKREKKHLTIMMIDIDYFKLYNDTYGHLQGDEIIRKVAQVILQHSNRSSDFIARYGGEEFAVILSDTQLENGKTIAENIRNEIATLMLPHKASTTASYVTISIGLASALVKDKNEVLHLIAQADDALYEAKSSGRNTIATQN